jgi:hypothetical protein
MIIRHTRDRLYAGFAGNLQEKVPLLMGFVSLSFFIILPVYAYFWYGQERVQPFDKALNTVAIALLAAEVFAARLCRLNPVEPWRLKATGFNL